MCPLPINYDVGVRFERNPRVGSILFGSKSQGASNVEAVAARIVEGNVVGVQTASAPW